MTVTVQSNFIFNISACFWIHTYIYTYIHTHICSIARVHKVKQSCPCPGHEGTCDSGSIIPATVKPITGWRWAVGSRPSLFYPQDPLGTGQAPGRVSAFWRQEKPLPVAENTSMNPCPHHSLVTIPTMPPHHSDVSSSAYSSGWYGWLWNAWHPNDHINISLGSLSISSLNMGSVFSCK
jgi:hypothetical protein